MHVKILNTYTTQFYVNANNLFKKGRRKKYIYLIPKVGLFRL